MTQFGYFLNIDKPAGMTSRDVVNRVIRVVGTRRVGHAGTLDPLATGVLVIAVDRATRLIEYVQDTKKTYRATIRFGATSDTDDREGKVVFNDVPVIPGAAAVASAIKPLTGVIQQVPPQYSALKVAGKRAYAEARAGRPVELAAREAVIHQFSILAYDYPLLEAEIVCDGGTYIRSLARDLGQALGIGGLLDDLRRMAVGAFTVADALTLEQLMDYWGDRQIPLATAVAHMPSLRLPDSEARRFTLGQRLPVATDLPSPIAVYSNSGDLLGIATAAGGVLHPRKSGF